MIKIFFITLLIVTFSINAEEVKSISFDDQVMSISIKDQNTYKLNLMGHAAQYWSKHKHLPCLDVSIKSRQSVKFTVDAFSLEVLDCQLSKK